MTDLRERFREYDEVAVPNLWDRIERLSETESVATGPRRSRALVAVAAVVVALVLIGGPLLLLTSIDRTEPVADTSTTAPQPRALNEVDPPWGETVSAVALLGDRGIVAIASNPDRVFWTPDRVDWFDADPDRRVAPRYVWPEERQFEDRIIVSTNGHVAVRSEANDGVWIAAPETGQWELVEFPSDESGDRTVRVLSLAANDTEVLVVTHLTSTGVVVPTGLEAPASIPWVHEYSVWLIDTSDGTIENLPLPLPASEWAENPMVVATWFNGQWVVAIHRRIWTDTDEGWVTSTPVVTSSDGRSWTIAESNLPPSSVTSISAGPAGMIATECNWGGDSFWYSEDGVNWEITTTDYLGHRSVYVDGLGYLTYYKGSPTAFSPDGREWQSPAAAGLTVHSFDGTDGSTPVDGNLFVVENRVKQWSIDERSDTGEGTG